MRAIGLIIVIIIIIVIVYNGVLWLSNNLSLGEIFYLPSGQSTSSAVETKKQTAPKIRIDTSPKISEPTKSSVTVTPPQGFTATDLSPDFGKVEVTSVRRPSSLGAGGGFTLRADFTLGELLDVTGWRIKSNDGEITIKGSISSVPPVNLARIILRPRTSAVFYTDRQSFVKNVELNKCTGYLNNNYDLNPRLPNNCPRPDRSETINFSGECQSFIRSLSSCEQPTSTELNRFTRPSNILCHEFLEDLNYGNCIREHSGDPDFYSYGWRIWTSDRLPFDRKHDRLLLFDGNNLLVDEHIY